MFDHYAIQYQKKRKLDFGAFTLLASSGKQLFVLREGTIDVYDIA